MGFPSDEEEQQRRQTAVTPEPDPIEEPIPGSTPEDYVPSDTPEEIPSSESAPEFPRLSQTPGSAMSNLNRIAEHAQSVKRFDARTAAANAKRIHNTKARRDSKQTGAQYLTDERGLAQPVIDAETGKRKFTPSTTPVRFDASGKPYQVRISEDGSRTIEDPDQNADYGENPDDPNDPLIYRRTKATPWQPVDPEEGLKSSDGKLVAASARLLHRRELEKIESDRADIALKLGDPSRPPKLAPTKREELATTREALQVETPKPAPKSGMFGIGVNQQATADANTAWIAQEEERKAQLSKIDSALALDDERAGMEKQSYELAVAHKSAKDGGPVGFLGRRRAQSAAGLANLPPEQAAAELEKRGAELQGADQEITARSTKLQERSAALNLEQQRGVTAERSAEIERERAGLLSESQAIQESLARRNAMADETNAGIQGIQQKRSEQTKADRAKIRENPATAPFADRLDALDAEATQRFAAVQAMPDGPEKQAATDALQKELQAKQNEISSEFGVAASGGFPKSLDETKWDAADKKAWRALPREKQIQFQEEKNYRAVYDKIKGHYDYWKNQTFDEWKAQNRDYLSANNPNATNEELQAAFQDSKAVTLSALEGTYAKQSQLHSRAVNNIVMGHDGSLTNEESQAIQKVGKVFEGEDDPNTIIEAIKSGKGLEKFTPAEVAAYKKQFAIQMRPVMEKLYPGTSDLDKKLFEEPEAADHVRMWYHNNAKGFIGVWTSLWGGADEVLAAIFKGTEFGRERQAKARQFREENTGVQESFPDDPRMHWLTTAGIQGVTQAAPNIATAFLGTAANFTSNTLQMLQQDKGQNFEAIAAREAQKKGLTPEQWLKNVPQNERENFEAEATWTALRSAIPNAVLETFADKLLIGKVPWDKIPGGKYLKRQIAKFSGSRPKLALGAKILTDGAVKSGFEGLQEGQQQILSNLNTSSISGDFSGKTLTKGLGQNIVAGAAGGAMFAPMGIADSLPKATPAKPAAPAILPEQVAAVKVQIDNWQPPAGLSPEGAQTERLAASGAIKLISGRPMESLLAEERTALESKLPDKSPRMEDVGGVPVITKGQLSRLQQVAPMSAELAIRDEESLRGELLQKNEEPETPQQSGTPTDQTGSNPPASGANRPQTQDSTGQAGITTPEGDLNVSRGTDLPPLPVGKFGPLVTPKEKGASKQLQARLAGTGIDASTAKDYADYFVRREGTTAWGAGKIDAAVAEFEKAGGRTNPTAIRKAIFSSSKSQQPEIEAIHAKVVSDLGAEYVALPSEKRARLDHIIRLRIAPELLTYAGAVREIAANMGKKGGGGVGVSQGMTFNFNVGDLLSASTLRSLQDDAGAERTVNEEISHLANITALAKIRSSRTGEAGDAFDSALAEAGEIFGDLPKEVQDHVRAIRGKELLEAPGVLGMEFFRMFLQHDIAIADGKFTTADGVVLTEQTMSPDLVERLREVFRKLLAAFGEIRSTLSAQLTKEGRPKEEIDDLLGRIDQARKESVKIFRNFQKAADNSRRAAYEAQYAGRTPTDAAATGTPQPAGGSEGRGGNQRGHGGHGGGDTGGTMEAGTPAPGGPRVPAGSTGAPANAARDARLAQLEAEKSDRDAAAERALERRNLAVQRRAEASGSKEAILSKVPQDARALVADVLTQVQMGSSTYVLGANRERLPASYVAAAPGTVQASHAGTDFHKNPLYGGENTRPYHSDETEQNKVLSMARAGALDEDSVVTDAKSASDGPAQVVLAIFNDSTGALRVSLQTAGGNGREQGVNLAPLADQERLSDAWSARGAQFGLSDMPDGWRGYRFLGVYDLRDEARNREYQQLVDKLNPNQGVVQDTAARADIDAALNIPVERLLDIPLSLSPESARDVMVGLVRDSEKLGIDRNLVAGLVKNPAQSQFYIQRLLIAAAFRSKALGEFVTSAQWSSGHATIASLIKSATGTALQLRSKGHGNIADAIGRTLERVSEYARNGRKLNLAISQAAEQQEIGEDGPVIQAIASARAWAVEFLPKNKKGIFSVDADETSAGFDDLLSDLASGVEHFTGEADLLGSAPTMAETLNAAIEAHFRKVSSISPQLQSRGTGFNRSRRIRDLQRKRQGESLTRWESAELTQLEKTSGQEFMGFFDQALSDNFQLETQLVRIGIPRAPVEQMQLMARRPVDSPSRQAAEDILAQALPQETNVPADHPSRKKLERSVQGAWNGLPEAFRAAVEADAANGYPGLPGFMPSPRLTRYERTIEAHFAAQISKSPEESLGKYTALAKEDFGEEAEGRYLNADLARDVYPLYRDNKDLRPAIDRATLAPAGYITSRLAWDHWLKNTDPSKRGTVVFMAGGMASGKTTSVHKTYDDDDKRRTAIFMDTVLGNYDRAVRMIGEVEAAGLTPHLTFVYRPFQNASEAAIQRLRDIGRPLDKDSLGQAHYEAQKVFLRLYREFGDKYPFEVITNEGHIDHIYRSKGVDDLMSRAYGSLEDENQRDQEAKTDRAGGPNRTGEASPLRPREGRVEGQARGQTPEGSLRNLPEAEAKRRLAQIYHRVIQSADLPMWEKTAVVHGYIPPAVQLQARRASKDDQTGDLFAFSAPEIAAYDKALQGEGISAPSAKAAAAMSDLGVSAPVALDLFGSPLTNGDPKRISNQEPQNENQTLTRGAANPARKLHAGRTQERPPDGGMGDLFSVLAGQRDAERDSGTTRGAGGGVLGVDGPEGAPTREGDETRRPGGDGSPQGTLPVSGGLGGKGGRSASPRPAKKSNVIAQPGSGVTTQRPPVGDPARNITLSRDQALAPRGTVSKLRANLEALRIIKAMESEGRLATAEEKQALVKFSGWGALSQAFDDDKADRVENGEIETRRRTAERTRSYGDSDYYRSEAESQLAAAQSLENWKNQWGEAHAELKSLLNEEEYRAAKRSTINAHYTSPQIIASMWDIAKWMGFKGGNVLEPGAGIGHFFGLMPEEIADRSKLFGVELDSYTSKILKALYPEADIQNIGFQKADIADNSIDLAISNVPFANIPVADKALEAMGGPVSNLHDYFFGKALTKLKPGGVQIFITSAFTMDKGNPEIRKWLSERADLVAAYRLPNDAFKDNAGTDVVTDIIVLRKKDGKPFPHAQAWTTLGDAKTQKGADIRINEYFAANPKNILGLLDNDGSMYGEKEEMTVHGDSNRPPSVAMQQDLATIPQGIMGEVEESGPVRNGASVVKMGNIVYRDGKYYFQGHDEPDADLNAPKNAPRVSRFLDVRDALNRQYDLELSDTASAEEIEDNRRQLNQNYDAFKAKFAEFHDRRNKALFIDDPDYFRLLGAEVEKAANKGTSAILEWAKKGQKKEYVKADIFTKRVLEPRSEPTKADTLEDAFGISLGWRNSVDSRFMADLLGQTPEQVENALLVQEIAVRDPETGRLFSREQYLSGNVRKKLIIAQSAGPDYARNVRMLESIQPQRVGIEDIRFSVGATWIPADIYNRFLESLGVSGYRFVYKTENERSEWEMVRDKRNSKSGVEYKDYETTSAPIEGIMDSLLNLKAITITKSEKEGGGIDQAATTAARERAKLLGEKFISWVRGTEDVAAELAEVYNQEVNSHVQRTYDGQFLAFPWANKDFNIYPDKKNTIWRAIQEGFGLIAHGVGGGKTIIGSGIALEMRRLGMARKPMIVVHNATLEGFAKEIAKMAPTARVLVGRKDELGGPKRKEFLMRIAAGDWDAVVIAHSTFGLIEDDPEVEIKHSRALVDEAMATLKEKGYDSVADAKEDRRKPPTVKALVKQIEKLEGRIDSAKKRRTDTGLLNFQQLGVDALIVDEVHEFKKMPFSTQLEAKGIDGGMSAKGYALLMRARQIQAQMGGKNVFSMTGTPVTNTLGEIWNMIRLVAPNVLRDYKVELFDQFVSKFAVVTTESEMGANGDFKNVDRLSRFVNLPEWATFLRQAADVKLGDDLVVKNRPGIKGGAPELVAVPRSNGVAEWVRYIRGVLDDYSQLDGKDIAENPSLGAVPVQAFMASRAAAIDIRLIEPRAKDEPGSKVNRMIGRLMDLYHDTDAYKGTQVIFADSFNQQKITLFDAVTPSSLDIELDPEKGPGTTFNLYDDIREKLIAQGIPAEEIAVITDSKWNNDKKKLALFDMVNEGKIRVIIGSTKKLGTGVNMQQRMIAAHHLDVPWTPAELEQRDGRVFRQGNVHGEMGVDIELLRYGMEDTLDAALWQKLETKQRFAYAALSGKIKGRELAEDKTSLNLQEQRAVLSGRYGRRLWEINTRLDELRMSRYAHEMEADRRKSEISNAQNHLRIYDERIARLAPSVEKMRRLAAGIAEKGIVLAVDGETFETKAATAEAVKAALDASRGSLRLSADGRQISPPVTSITVNGTPIFLHPTVKVDNEWDEDAKRMVQRSAVTFDLVTGAADAENDLSFGVVTSPGTLLSRLEELVDTVESLGRGQAMNSERLRQLAGMSETAAWPYQEEYDTLSQERVETEALYADERHQRAHTPQQLQARKTTYDPNQELFDFDSIPEDRPAAQADAELYPLDRFKAELPQAMRIASAWNNIPGVDQEEIRQVARLALADSARKFDGTLGKPFSAYAGVSVRNRLRSLYRKEDTRRSLFPVSLDEPRTDDPDSETRGDFAADTRTLAAPDAAALRESRRVLDKSISALTPQMQIAIQGFSEHKTLEQIGQDMGGLSKQRAEQVLKAALRIMRKNLGERGLNSTLQLMARGYQVDETPGDSYGQSNGISRPLPHDAGKPVAQTGKGSQTQSPWHPSPDKSAQAYGGPYGIPAERAFQGISYAPAREWGVARLADFFQTTGGERERSIAVTNSQLPIYRSDYKANATDFALAQEIATKEFQKTIREIDSAYASHPGRAYWMLPRTPQARALFTDASGKVHLLDHPGGEISLSENQALFARGAEETNSSAEEDFSDIDALLRDLDSEIPDYQAAALVEEDAGGRKTIGRPDLAHGADNADVRGADQYYTDHFSPQSETQWQLEADNMLASDYAGTKLAIERAGLGGQTISPAQTKAAEKIATDLRNAMLKTGTPESRAAFNVFWLAFRGTGTAAGRALASRRDPLKTPAQRYRDFLTDLILKPRPAAQKAIDAAATPAEKTAIIDAETKALLEKLKASGINVDDILKDRVTLSLQNRNIIEEFVQLLARAAGDKESRQRAFRMILRNRSFSDIAKAAGISESEVKQIKTDFIAKMRAQHFAKFQAGAKADSATLITGKTVDDATAEREFSKWLGVLGIVDDAKQGRPRFNIEDPAHVMRMARAIQAATRANVLDMAYEWWIMNILSGPQTQFVNIAGNTVNAAWDMTVQRGMEATVNLVIRDSKAARLGEFRFLAKGLLPGMAKGLSMVARAWSAEHDFFEHTVLGTPMEIDNFDKAGNVRSAIPGKLGRLVRVPGRALLFADSFFKTAIGQVEVGAVAYRIAKSEGLSGKKLTDRVALLSQTRDQVIAGNIAKARPSAEMVEFFAKALAQKDETLKSDDLIADRSSQAWEMAREQTAFDMAREAGWSDAAWQRAVEKSKELTFQQDLRESEEGGNMVEDLAAKIQTMRGSNRLLGLFFPFVRTPYNIFRMGIRKTPLGSANLAWQVGRGLMGLKNGQPYLTTHPEAVRDVSEQLIAWTALALLWGAAQGDGDDDDKPVLITGSMPYNLISRGQRELQQRAYGGDYVIRIGGRNGWTFHYGRYEPLATVLGTTIDTIRAIKSKGATADNMDALYGYLMAQAQSKTFLQGFSDISRALEGSANVGEGTKRFLMQAIVPNIIRQPLRNLDDYVRDTKHAEAMYQALPSGDFAPPKTTIYGKDMQKGGNPVLRLFLTTPLKADAQLESADRLLLNWNRENPSQAYAPQAPADTYQRAGKEHKMTAEQYHRFSVASGRFASAILKGKLTAAKIAKPKIDDVDTIRKAFEDARTMTRKRMFP